jgi:hypothetical protein
MFLGGKRRGNGLGFLELGRKMKYIFGMGKIGGFEIGAENITMDI